MSDDVTLDDVDPDDPDPTWPRTRPVARWAVSLLPDGATLPSYEGWDVETRNEYLVDLLDSPELAPLVADDGEDAVRNASLALDFSLDRLDDDPDRWSPRKLAMLLLDFVPQKVIAPADELLGLVDVMRAWTRRSARVRDLSAEASRNLRDALDALEPEFRHALDDAAAHPNLTMQALLDAAGLDSVEELAALDPGELIGLLPGGILTGGPGLGSSTEYGMTRILEEAVGGPQQIRRLTTVPLPDEPFDPTGIDDDVLPRITLWLSLAEDVLARFFPGSVELRTALRRTTALIALGNPDFLRRKSDDARGAAALLQLVLHGNGVVGWSGTMTNKELVAAFGITTSVTERQEPMLRALGITADTTDWGLGDPGLLTSDQRRSLIEMWERFGEE